MARHRDSVYAKLSIFDNDEDYEDPGTDFIELPVLNLPPYKIPPPSPDPKSKLPLPLDYPKTSNDEIQENLCWRPPKLSKPMKKSGINGVGNPCPLCNSHSCFSITRSTLKPEPNQIPIPIKKSYAVIPAQTTAPEIEVFEDIVKRIRESFPIPDSPDSQDQDQDLENSGRYSPYA